MLKILKSMDEEKKNRIINSALDEFSNNTFDKASTNNIVKNANISKGLLYHYFKTKKNLYDYLEIFAMTTIADAILNEMNWDETDLFFRIKETLIIKFKILAKYPKILSFSKRMYENKTIDELKKLVEKYVPEIYYQIYYKNIDFDKFKDDYEIEYVMKIIQWTLEKVGEESIEKSNFLDGDKYFEEIIKEIDIYIIMLKKMFYKEEV